MLINPRPDPSPASHDRVYRGLRTRIMHGEIAPGQPLTLRGVGEEFGVSMTPAREAIRRLTAEGALTLSSSGRVSTPELGNDRIEELAALRALIEVELASRALPRAHIALIDRLQSINGLITENIARHDAVDISGAIWSFTARFTCGRRPRRCWLWRKPSGCSLARPCARSTANSPARTHRITIA